MEDAEVGIWKRIGKAGNSLSQWRLYVIGGAERDRTKAHREGRTCPELEQQR